MRVYARRYPIPFSTDSDKYGGVVILPHFCHKIGCHGNVHWDIEKNFRSIICTQKAFIWSKNCKNRTWFVFCLRHKIGCHGKVPWGIGKTGPDQENSHKYLPFGEKIVKIGPVDTKIALLIVKKRKKEEINTSKIYGPSGKFAEWAKKEETRNVWQSLAYSPLGSPEWILMTHTYLLIAALHSSPSPTERNSSHPQKNYRRRLYKFLCLKLWGHWTESHQISICVQKCLPISLLKSKLRSSNHFLKLRVHGGKNCTF